MYTQAVGFQWDASIRGRDIRMVCLERYGAWHGLPLETPGRMVSFHQYPRFVSLVETERTALASKIFSFRRSRAWIPYPSGGQLVGFYDREVPIGPRYCCTLVASGQRCLSMLPSSHWGGYALSMDTEPLDGADFLFTLSLVEKASFI